jgi:hypothetical protein|tara:strand:- start:5755 stop:6474 length:720 start_codon:yes stop_codon:yes gene_type:complete
MDLLVSGDSFTAHGNSITDFTWPRFLKEHNPQIEGYKNVAMGNGSNLYIARSVIDSVLEMDNVDYVICQWTMDCRGSAPGAKKYVWWNGLPSYQIAEMYNDVELIEDDVIEFRTLENILRTQWFLESKNIKYKFFFGWKTNFQRCKQFRLYDELNLDNWWKFKVEEGIQPLPQEDYEIHDNKSGRGFFPNSTNDNWNGMLEWVVYNVENGIDTTHHPSEDSHKQFAEKVVSKWLEEEIK